MFALEKKYETENFNRKDFKERSDLIQNLKSASIHSNDTEKDLNSNI